MPIEIVEVKASDTIDTGRQTWNTNDDTLADAANSLTDQQEAHVAAGHPDLNYTKSETDSVLSNFLAAITNALLGAGTILAGMIKGSGANKAVDGTSIGLNGSDELEVKDDGISTVKILNANVTPAKFSYKEYVAILNQSGTGAPTATVVSNTLSSTPTWSYNGVGDYELTLTGEFTVNKTVAIITLGFTSNLCVPSFTPGDVNYMRLITRDQTANPANSLLDNAFIIIRVYP